MDFQRPSYIGAEVNQLKLILIIYLYVYETD